MSERCRLSTSERIEIVKCHTIYQNAGEVAHQFQDHYDRTFPIRTNILNLIQKLNETGSVQDEPRFGGSRSVSIDKNRERIRAAFQKSSETSSIRASFELNLARTSLRRMMKELELKPYHPHLLHALSNDDSD